MAPVPVHVRLIGHNCVHDLCYPIDPVNDRGVPAPLRCSPTDQPGYSNGGGGVSCCVLPQDLKARVLRRMRDYMRESILQGYVEVHVG
jgi:hypothetical protein